MAERSQQHALIVPIFAGLIGAGVALLLAPRSGRETRAKLRNEASERARQARAMKQRLGATLDRSEQAAKDAMEDIKDTSAQIATQKEG